MRAACCGGVARVVAHPRPRATGMGGRQRRPATLQTAAPANRLVVDESRSFLAALPALWWYRDACKSARREAVVSALAQFRAVRRSARRIYALRAGGPGLSKLILQVTRISHAESRSGTRGREPLELVPPLDSRKTATCAGTAIDRFNFRDDFCSDKVISNMITSVMLNKLHNM